MPLTRWYFGFCIVYFSFSHRKTTERMSQAESNKNLFCNSL